MPASARSDEASAISFEALHRGEASHQSERVGRNRVSFSKRLPLSDNNSTACGAWNVPMFMIRKTRLCLTVFPLRPGVDVGQRTHRKGFHLNQINWGQ